MIETPPYLEGVIAVEWSSAYEGLGLNNVFIR